MFGITHFEQNFNLLNQPRPFLGFLRIKLKFYWNWTLLIAREA